MSWNDAEKTMILQNSLERVLNNAIWIAEGAMRSKNSDFSERAGILYDDLTSYDCLAVKVATKLWNEARNNIFIEKMNAEKGEPK